MDQVIIAYLKVKEENMFKEQSKYKIVTNWSMKCSNSNHTVNMSSMENVDIENYVKF